MFTIYKPRLFSAKYETPSDILESELHQLGLPKEHANALCKIYTKVQSDLAPALIKQSLQHGRKNVKFDFTKESGAVACYVR